jgi:catechol 2,3-dioxygenase-like lactoylglutathione lyase family enzyme
MQPRPLIAVRDVEASSRWYQYLLGCESGHGGKEYERIVHNGTVVLQLHDWHAHGHRYLGDETSKPYGNGVLLWFVTEDFEAAVGRARELNAEILEERFNEAWYECWLRDPDGYVIVLSSG